MKRLHCVFALLALCLCLASPATAELPRPGGSHDLITMNFQDVDISVLAKFISDITGKNFVVDEGVRGKVSIISPTKVTPEQAYSVYFEPGRVYVTDPNLNELAVDLELFSGGTLP